MKTRTNPLWYLPVVLGVLFILSYVWLATDNVAISDYIRLIIAYLPDTLNPAKFFVPDILTRAPLTYLFRWINVTFFAYNTEFDIVLGVISLGLGALAFGWWARKREIGTFWYLAVLIVWFGLNKWEMLGNGTGWVCILSLSGFLYSFILLDFTAKKDALSSGQLRLSALLPLILTFTVTGVYCAAYIAVYVLGCLMLSWNEIRLAGEGPGSFFAGSTRRLKNWRNGSLIAVLSLGLFVLSNHFAVWEYSGAYEGSITEIFFRNPLFFVRFLLNSFASDLVDRERLEDFVSRHQIHGGQAVLFLGACVLVLYLWALIMNLRRELWKQSPLPLLLILYSGLSHLLILVSRTRFLNDHYGMSSRYAIQYEMGIIGILLTFALLLAGPQTARGASRKKKPETRPVRNLFLHAFCVISVFAILGGSIYTTACEYQFGHYRKEFLQKSREVALNYRTASDEEIQEYLQKDGEHARKAMAILEENHLNVFHQ